MDQFKVAILLYQSLLNARISAKSAKPAKPVQRGRMFRRPSKPAKSTVYRLLTETNMNSKSTKNGIGPNHLHTLDLFEEAEGSEGLPNLPSVPFSEN